MERTAVVSKDLAPWVRNQVQTCHAQIAAFLRKFWGVEHPIFLSIHNYRGMAVLVVALDPNATDMSTIGRQITLADKKLWVVRPINNVPEIIFFTEALKYLGFNLPQLRFYKSKGRLYSLQEFLVRANPCFTGRELSAFAPRTLPVVLAALGRALPYLNLTLNKFITVGHQKFFIGLRPNHEPIPLDYIANNLLVARLIDPQKGLEQFEEGIKATEVLDSKDFEETIKQQMQAAKIPEAETDAFIAEKRAHRRERLVCDLERLLHQAQAVLPLVEDRISIRERLMIPKERLVDSRILPYVSSPEKDGKEKAEQTVLNILTDKTPTDLIALVDEIIRKGAKIIRIEGGTARGKTTFIELLSAALSQRGKKVVPIHIDDLTLKTAQERFPQKVAIAEAAGLGFVSYSDESLSFNTERTREIIAALDFEEGKHLTLEARHPQKKALRGCRQRKNTKIDVTMDSDTILVLEGKFFCWPRYWEGIKTPTFTILLHSPAETAEKRAAKRGLPELARMQETLVSAWYDPSYFRYLEESGLLSQTNAIVDSRTWQMFLV
ncbi:MAG: hypothetical protein NT099_04805 [Candidatus Saganbacteria bacterium]|nr:hypothetical protein [Candidatus Saganbacteria bacterium]